ncbi:hypothetical protein HanXRQr2_Chr05g0196521 [Helianthus annuus]|uniref:Uncharacterized protein n=1 Tax=Helianthus annuus TaxID=4232 RepID=A0A9K3NKW1_HELAN|nr:hypothetical protein HanXRQr2_Chr05g0196521 [Helianthus annuus]
MQRVWTTKKLLDMSFSPLKFCRVGLYLILKVSIKQISLNVSSKRKAQMG